jgi:5-deoxy-glucuronate isomerase
MWYLWVIRHLEGNHYRTPAFTGEHTWVTGPEDKIWYPKR